MHLKKKAVLEKEATILSNEIAMILTLFLFVFSEFLQIVCKCKPNFPGKVYVPRAGKCRNVDFYYEIC